MNAFEIFKIIDEDFDFNDKSVTDLGAGTGLLSICSVFFGAEKVYSYEIDEKAI